MVTTKAEMTKILKRFGIRRGMNGNSIVPLEHMKYEDICVLFDEFEKNFDPRADYVQSTGDSDRFKSWLEMQVIKETFGD